jgi:uncharacterized protein YcbK (DUF882 family)
MRFDNGYIYWHKGEVFNITKNFTNREFECDWDYAGDQDEQRISIELVSGLQWVRDRLKQSIKVTSGFRFWGYHEQIYKGLQARDARQGKAPRRIPQASSHLSGNAADITSPDLIALRHWIEQYFKAIGYGRNFYHVDTRNDVKRTWTY